MTLIEAAAILGNDDPEVSTILKSRLQMEGVKLVEGVGVAKVGGSAGRPDADARRWQYGGGEPSSGCGGASGLH